jgi:hypothetical protein
MVPDAPQQLLTRAQLLGRQALPLSDDRRLKELALQPGARLAYLNAEHHAQPSVVAVRVQVGARLSVNALCLQAAAGLTVRAPALQHTRTHIAYTYKRAHVQAQRHYGDEGRLDTSQYDADKVRCCHVRRVCVCVWGRPGWGFPAQLGSHRVHS